MIELYWGSGSPWAWRVMLALAILVATLVIALLWMAGGVQSARTFEAAPIELSSVPAGTRTSTETEGVWFYNSNPIAEPQV